MPVPCSANRGYLIGDGAWWEHRPTDREYLQEWVNEGGGTEKLLSCELARFLKPTERTIAWNVRTPIESRCWLR